MHLHATVRAWQREEDGSYKAEIAGHLLHVVWHPEAGGKRRGFSWHARPAADPDAKPSIESEKLEEEIEIAMAQAEHAVARGQASG
jgi:hypothetical protein